MKLSVLTALSLVTLAACGGGNKEESSQGAAVTPATEKAAKPAKSTGKTGFRGTLYFDSAEPLKKRQVMAMDLKKGGFHVAIDGSSGSGWGKDMAFIESCSPLAVRLSVMDTDGFTNPVSECVERDSITPDFFAPAISPDGKYVAITNTALPPKKASKSLLSIQDRAATQVYNRSGKLVAEFDDMGPSAWTPDGHLLLAGLGGDTGFGIYRADKGLKSTSRIDDGRLNGPITAMDANPKGGDIAFIFNSGLWTMDLASGKPQRRHAHGFPLAGLAYAPDGKNIAIVSDDPLDEGMTIPGDGYPVFVWTGEELETINLPFIPGAPMDWTE